MQWDEVELHRYYVRFIDAPAAEILLVFGATMGVIFWSGLELLAKLPLATQLVPANKRSLFCNSGFISVREREKGAMKGEVLRHNRGFRLVGSKTDLRYR